MKKFFLVTVTLLALGAPLCAQTLDEVLAMNYKAHGGLDRLKSLKSWKMTGKIVIPAQGLDMPMALWQKSPSQMRVESIFQGQKIVQAFDGATAWWIMPFLSEKAQKMPAEQGKLFADQADFENPLVVFREKGHKLELLGREDMAGTPVFKLKLTKADGREIHYFLDATSGIDLKSTLVVKAGESESVVEVLYGDYKPVDGHMMPFAIENKMNGQTQMQMTIEAIEINPALADAFFAMPVEEAEPKAEKAEKK